MVIFGNKLQLALGYPLRVLVNQLLNPTQLYISLA